MTRAELDRWAVARPCKDCLMGDRKLQEAWSKEDMVLCVLQKDQSHCPLENGFEVYIWRWSQSWERGGGGRSQNYSETWIRHWTPMASFIQVPERFCKHWSDRVTLLLQVLHWLRVPQDQIPTLCNQAPARFCFVCVFLDGILSLSWALLWQAWNCSPTPSLSFRIFFFIK